MNPVPDKQGKRCSMLECRQIDWMPVNCKYCRKDFCPEHSSIQSHKCTEIDKTFNKVMICPFCEKTVKIDNTKSVQESFAHHEAYDCPHSPKKKQQPGCSQCKAKVNELTSYKCKECDRIYCGKHRLKEDHTCVSGYNRKWRDM